MASGSKPRKRDVFKRILKSSSEPSPAPAPAAAFTPSIAPTALAAPTVSTDPTAPTVPGVLPVPLSAAPRLPISQRIYETALSRLTKEEQDFVKENGTDDIDASVHDANKAVLKQKVECEAKRWQLDFRGQRIVLRDHVAKVARFLDMLKPVGDAAAALDPLHAGLPWGAVKTLLGIVLADSKLTAALVAGMDIVLLMANRLRVYLRFSLTLPEDLATENLEEALIKMHVQLLQFLYTAKHLYGSNTASRSVKAMWKVADVEEFVEEIIDLARHAETEASNCDRVLRQQDRELAVRLKSQLDLALDKLRDIRNTKTSVEQLSVKVDLSALKTATGATFDSNLDGHATKCLEGTRVDLLMQIEDWIHSRNETIFWLSGMAGTGKSTIARTLGHMLRASDHLAASFFFKRGEAERQRAGLFFPSIVKQLVDTIKPARQAVAAALDADSLLCERSLQHQFNELMIKPFSALDRAQLQTDLCVIIVDALDECEHDHDIRTLIELLCNTASIAQVRIKIFVTSRPDLPIRLGFKEQDKTIHYDIELEAVQQTAIESDLTKYFEHRFDRISQDHGILQTDWPSEAKIAALVKLATPLFIFASTVCRYIQDDSDPEETLDRVLAFSGGKSYNALHRLYLPILQREVGRNVEDDEQQVKKLADFHLVVGAIILLAEPLSAIPLAGLLSLRVNQIQATLKNLHSVLDVSDDRPIRTLHLSFRDFLLDSAEEPAAGIYHIKEKQTYGTLARHCLDLLSSSLHQNICCLSEPGTRSSEVDSSMIDGHIQADVAYACLHWVSHLVESGEDLFDECQAHRFLKTHLLHWIEALSWLGRLSAAFESLFQLQSRAGSPAQKASNEQMPAVAACSSRSQHITQLLRGALSFLQTNRYITDLAPLQLYHSALLFAPSDGIVRRLFAHEIPEDFTLSRDTEPEPDAAAVTLMLEQNKRRPKYGVFNDRRPEHVVFSPDDKHIAIAEDCGRVSLWNAWTGVPLATLRYDEYAAKLLHFSPNGRILYSWTNMGVARFDVESGLPCGPAIQGDVDCLAVCQPGEMMVALQTDYTTYSFDQLTGVKRACFSYDVAIDNISFSADRRRIAIYHSRSLRLIDSMSGLVLAEHYEEEQGSILDSVAFSRDSKQLAAVCHPFSRDSVVRLWNAFTGARMDATSCNELSRDSSSDRNLFPTPETVVTWSEHCHGKIFNFCPEAIAGSSISSFYSLAAVADHDSSTKDFASRDVLLSTASTDESNSLYRNEGKVLGLTRFNKQFSPSDTMVNAKTWLLPIHTGSGTDVSNDGQDFLLALVSDDGTVRLRERLTED